MEMTHIYASNIIRDLRDYYVACREFQVLWRQARRSYDWSDWPRVVVAFCQVHADRARLLRDVWTYSGRSMERDMFEIPEEFTIRHDLQGEMSRMTDEITELRSHVEHLKTVVPKQYVTRGTAN